MSAWMQKQQARSSRAAAVASAVAEDASEHASEQRISMYAEAPSGEVCIEDFEHFAIDRLRGDCCNPASSCLKDFTRLQLYFKMTTLYCRCFF